jgi:hypothetical protein
MTNKVVRLSSTPQTSMTIKVVRLTITTHAPITRKVVRLTRTPSTAEMTMAPTAAHVYSKPSRLSSPGSCTPTCNQCKAVDKADVLFLQLF